MPKQKTRASHSGLKTSTSSYAKAVASCTMAGTFDRQRVANMLLLLQYSAGSPAKEVALISL
jgi:hypothetical protein